MVPISPHTGTVTDFVNLAGRGVNGHVDTVPIRVGRRTLFESSDAELDDHATAAREDGHTVVFAGRGATVEAVMVVADTPKDSSAAAVAALHEAGMSTLLLTGDLSLIHI